MPQCTLWTQVSSCECAWQPRVTLTHSPLPVRTLLMTEKRMRPSTLQVLRNTKNLYRGFGVVAALTFPAHALYFIGYEETKRQLGDSDTVRVRPA
jgi:hypothetical protein